MTGLVQLLRQRDVYYELIVFPDDVHESLLHSRWIYTLGRMETFLHKFLSEATMNASKIASPASRQIPQPHVIAQVQHILSKVEPSG